jgi:adenylate kinase family enzyme
MATAHLLNGYLGVGKTTLARRLEHELPAVRFTHDEWMISTAMIQRSNARKRILEATGGTAQEVAHLSNIGPLRGRHNAQNAACAVACLGIVA